MSYNYILCLLSVSSSPRIMDYLISSKQVFRNRCFEIVALEQIFQNSCSRIGISKQLFQKSYSRTTIPKHLFQNIYFETENLPYQNSTPHQNPKETKGTYLEWRHTKEGGHTKSRNEEGTGGTRWREKMRRVIVVRTTTFIGGKGTVAGAIAVGGRCVVGKEVLGQMVSQGGRC